MGHHSPCIGFPADDQQLRSVAGEAAGYAHASDLSEDAIKRARAQLPSGPGRSNCEECGEAIPEARRQAVPGVRLCIACQAEADREVQAATGYNRRGSKDSQLR